MHVVEEDDNGRVAGQILDHHGQRLAKAETAWLGARSRAAHDGDAAQQTSEIVQVSATQADDFRPRSLPEMVFERLDPQSERGHRAEGISTRDEPDGGTPVAGEHLGSQARLADARIPDEKDAAELSGGGPLELRLQLAQLGRPADETQAVR